MREERICDLKLLSDYITSSFTLGGCAGFHTVGAFGTDGQFVVLIAPVPDVIGEDIWQGEELVPSEVVYAILDGGKLVRVLREYRGFTKAELSKEAGISKPYLSQIETGKRKGTTLFNKCKKLNQFEYN